MIKNKKIILTACALAFTGLLSTAIFADTNNTTNDATITAAVKEKLASDPTSPGDINVNTHDGVVTLTGKVKTDNDATAAIEKAEATEGVKDVNSKLVVEKGKQPAADTMITAKIKGLLIREKVFGDKEISLINTSVETKNGVVYLTGKVDDKTKIDSVIKLAKTIHGVKKVVNQMQVVPINN